MHPPKSAPITSPPTVFRRRVFSFEEQILNTLNVEYRKVETLIPYARNPRTHNDAQIAKIAASIVEYGWTNPVLVDGDNGIIAGHGRLAAARKLELADVPVIELAHLSAAQKRAYVIADNRLALDAGWDEEMLALEVAELSEAGYDLALTGFEDGELQELLAGVGEAEEPNADAQDDEAVDGADDVPEVPATPVSRAGDVWAIGAHRLICGDVDDGQVLVNLGLIHRDNEFVPYWTAWLDWMRTKGWRRFGWYVWDQGPGMPGDWQGRFAPSFEFVFHFNRASRKPNKIVPCKFAGQETHLRADGSSTAMRGKDGEVGGWTHKGQPTQDTRIPDSVIRVMRHKGKIGQDIDHPAVFPVALPQFVIEAFSATGDLVFEPFGGSGSTMLAAQRTGRVCRSVEIAPEYVDVAIRRFRQNHPEVAVTLLETGQSFDDVAAEREVEVMA